MIWLSAVSDAMIAAAFLAIAFVLGFFVWRRRRDVMFRSVFWAVAIVTAVCGVSRINSDLARIASDRARIVNSASALRRYRQTTTLPHFLSSEVFNGSNLRRGVPRKHLSQLVEQGGTGCGDRH